MIDLGELCALSDQFYLCCGICPKIMQNFLELFWFRSGLLGVSLSLVACAPLVHPPVTATPAHALQATPADTVSAQPAASSQKDAVLAENPAMPMPAETMSDLIQAESAINQGHPEQALPYYVEEAEATQDPQILERAIQLCSLTHHHHIALQLAKIWINKDPLNIGAQSAMASSLWHLGHYQQAVAHLAIILQKDPDAQFGELVLSQPARSAVEDQRIDTALQQLKTTLPNNVNVFYTYAFWLAHAKKFTPALAACTQAEQKDPGFIPASLLHAQLLEFTQHSDAALDYLNTKLQKKPAPDVLLQNKAALLVRMGRFQEAENTYQLLTQQHPENGDFLLSHALLAIQNRHDEAARQSLTALLKVENHQNDAYFYLGQLNASQHHQAEALKDFNAVTPGPDFLPAQQAAAALHENNQEFSEAVKDLDTTIQKYPKYQVDLKLIKADLLSDHQQYDAAAHVLDELLKISPENTDVVYSRAMVAVQQNNLPLFENLIHKILDKNPENAVALNALGYTLADRTPRLQEAETDIKKALTLSPKDPAIIDSMGWVEFRMGHRDTALKYLAEAWGLNHDDEIGSHYGELLWVNGQKEAAEKIWNEAMQLHPHSPFVPATRHRLGAP